MCLSISGQISLASIKIAGSAMIKASGPISFSSFKYSAAPSRSSLCARIFTVTWTLAPWSCANRTPSFMSSMEKFFAFARSPNASPPIYTASAPNITAVFNTSRLLAGISNSGCLFLILSILLLFFFLLNAECHTVSQWDDRCLQHITVF